MSFCCSNTGKKASNSVFEDYEGCTFTTDDVITALIDFSQGNQVQISYMKNGDSLGTAFTFPKSQLGMYGSKNMKMIIKFWSKTFQNRFYHKMFVVFTKKNQNNLDFI